MEVLTTVPTIYKHSWFSGDIPVNCMLTNVMARNGYKKGQKKNLENYRPVSLISVLRKVME